MAPETNHCWNAEVESDLLNMWIEQQVVGCSNNLLYPLCFLFPHSTTFPLLSFYFPSLNTLRSPLRRHASGRPAQQRSLSGWTPSRRSPGGSGGTLQKEPGSMVHNGRFPKVQPQSKHKCWHWQPGTKGKLVSDVLLD